MRLEELESALNGVCCHRVAVREIKPVRSAGVSDELGLSAKPMGNLHKFLTFF